MGFFGKKGYMNAEWFLIVTLFFCIIICLWGLVGNKIVEDTAGTTCNVGIGFFCWLW
ncbi:MAG: hypothetical protein KC516_03215 [Nanoarchaeota archaeon]|nr:hypothetical protein [Nanoarchaeota archaeon]